MAEQEDRIGLDLTVEAYAAEQAAENPYGGIWRAAKGLTDKANTILQESHGISDTHDIVVATAAIKLLDQAIAGYRIVHFHSEMDDAESVQEDGLFTPAEFEDHTHKIVEAYKLDEEELARENEWRLHALKNFRRQRNHPAPLGYFHPNPQVPGEFQNIQLGVNTISVKSEDDGVTITLDGPMAIAIRTFSYPVKDVHIKFRHGQPVSAEVAFQFLDERYADHPLSQELQKHPDILAFVKEQLAGVVENFIMQPESFRRQRESDNTPEDPTQIASALFGFIEGDFLTQHLSPEDVEEVQHYFRVERKSPQFKQIMQLITVFQMAQRDFSGPMSIFFQDLGIDLESLTSSNYAKIFDAKIKEARFKSRFNQARKKAATGIDEIIGFGGEEEIQRIEKMVEYYSYLDTLFAAIKTPDQEV